jgi:hypothetical protein
VGDKLSKHELEEEGAELLPEREAMTLINTGSPLPLANPEGIPGFDSGLAHDQGMKLADSASTDAAASESGTPDSTDADRSESYSSSDSASSAT